MSPTTAEILEIALLLGLVALIAMFLSLGAELLAMTQDLVRDLKTWWKKVRRP